MTVLAAADLSPRPSTWRAAVLRGWSTDAALPLTTVAAISWNEPAPLMDTHVRWLPVLTEEEAQAQFAWFTRLANADPSVDVREFLSHHAQTATLDVIEVAVPAGSRTLPGVADLVLDDALAEPWFAQLGEQMFPAPPATIVVLGSSGSTDG